MTATETARPATGHSVPNVAAPGGSDIPSGQAKVGAQRRRAAGEQDPRPANVQSVPTAHAPGGPDIPSGHFARDAQELGAAGEQDTRPAKTWTSLNVCSPGGPGIPSGHEQDGTQHQLAAGEQDARPATDQTAPIAAPPGGTGTLNGQVSIDTQCRLTVEGQDSPQATEHPPPITAAPLADPLLALAADVLSDLEKVRIANENRLRQLTRAETDSDGETRGFGLDETHPDVARLAALVGMLRTAEHQATLNLGRRMRAHPLGPWVRDTVGVGEKQGARLLAAIGDPYIRPEITREDGTVEPSRPRLVSELWAYAGYHVIPASQNAYGTHLLVAGGEQDGNSGQKCGDSQGRPAGIAPKRSRGIRANWSGVAKMRAFLIAESCIKQAQSPYRLVYDATRAKYAEATHAVPCERCGPKGKPAQPGSLLSDGHKHARALRAVAKEVLRDLWRESKAIHEQRQRDAA